MNIKSISPAILAALLVAAPLFAQQSEPELTLEERVALLERELVNLDARLELRTTAASALGGPERDAGLATRVDQLERELSRLTLAIQRLEQRADNALREASQARREALDAQRAARDAASRLR